MNTTQKQLEDFMEESVEAINNINGVGQLNHNTLSVLIELLIEKGIIESGDIRNGLQKQAERRKQMK
jgi:hypothetical protein